MTSPNIFLHIRRDEGVTSDVDAVGCDFTVVLVAIVGFANFSEVVVGLVAGDEVEPDLVLWCELTLEDQGRSGVSWERTYLHCTTISVREGADLGHRGGDRVTVQDQAGRFLGRVAGIFAASLGG